MKIQLPNPDDFSVEQWFAQMRISLKAAEKTYQELVKHLTAEQKEKVDELPWIRFALPKSLIQRAEEQGQPDIEQEVQHELSIAVGQI